MCVLRGARLLAGILAGLLALAQMGDTSRSLMKTAIVLPGLISLVQGRPITSFDFSCLLQCLPCCMATSHEKVLSARHRSLCLSLSPSTFLLLFLSPLFLSHFPLRFSAGFKLEAELATGSRPTFHSTSRVVWFVYGISSLLLVPLLTQWGVMLTPAVMLIGLANLAVAIVEGMSMLGDEGLLAGNPPVFTIMMVLTSLGMSFYTNRWRNEKQKRIQSDIASFQTMWMMLIKNEESSREMTSMQTSVKRLHNALQYQGEVPRQFNGFYEYKGLDNINPVRVSRSEAMVHGQLRKGDSDPISARSLKSLMRFRLPLSVRNTSSVASGRSASLIGGSTHESRIDRSSPVTCLDQLYTSARVLQPMLRHKVQRWALGTRGCFRLANDSYELWENIVVSTQNGRGRDDVKWAQLKPRTRAMEKLEKCYFGDVSRLVDIVRERIVFRSMRDMHLCLKLIMVDQHVRVVRVTNRYRPKYDLFQTAGYRDLRLNLVIQNQLTADIGVDTHVAELQLVYEGFASLVTKGTKERYREIRDQRTEESGIYAAIESLREYLGETRFFGGCFDSGEAGIWTDLSGNRNAKLQKGENGTVEGLSEGSWSDGERKPGDTTDIPDDEDTITFPRLPKENNFASQKRFWMSGKFIKSIREATNRENILSKSISESNNSHSQPRMQSTSTSQSMSVSRSMSKSRSSRRSVIARIKSMLGLQADGSMDAGRGFSGNFQRSNAWEENEANNESDLDGFHIPNEKIMELTLTGTGRGVRMDSVVLEETEYDVERAVSKSGGTRSLASRTASGENFMRTSSANSILRHKQYSCSPRDSKTQSVEFSERVSSLTKSGDVSFDMMKSVDDSPEDGGRDRRSTKHSRKSSASSHANGKNSSRERSLENGHTLKGKLRSAASSMESVISRVASILSRESDIQSDNQSENVGSGSRKTQWRDHQDLQQAKEECSQHVRQLEMKLGTTFRKYGGEESRTQSDSVDNNVQDLPQGGVLGWSVDQALLFARVNSRGDVSDPLKDSPRSLENGSQISDLQKGLRKSKSNTANDGRRPRCEQLQGPEQNIQRSESGNTYQRAAPLETEAKDFKKWNLAHNALAASSTLEPDCRDSNDQRRGQDNDMRANHDNGDEAADVVVSVAAAANGKVDVSGRDTSVSDSIPPKNASSTRTRFALLHLPFFPLSTCFSIRITVVTRSFFQNKRCLFVCLFVCFFVCSSRPFLIRICLGFSFHSGPKR